MIEVEFINRNHDAWDEADMWDLIGCTIRHVVKKPERRAFNGEVMVGHGYNIYTDDGFIYGLFMPISKGVTQTEMFDVMRMVEGDQLIKQ